MPATPAIPPRLRHTRWLPWLMASLAFLLGLFLAAAFYRSMLLEDAEHNVQQLVAMSDALLDEADNVNRTVLKLAPQPCHKLRPFLLNLAMTSPYVRSINLRDLDGQLLCSSYLQADLPIRPDNSHRAVRLEMLSGTRLAPDVPILVLREQTGPYHVSSVVDLRYLAGSMRMADNYLPVYLRVGKRWVGMDSHVYEQAPAKLGLVQTSANSGRYDVTVVSGLPMGEGLRRLLTDYPLLLALLALIGALAAYSSYQMQRRADPMQSEMRFGLVHAEFDPWPQPLVDAQTGHWIGAEVLMRWRHPQQGLVPPNLFIPAAEDNGLIVPMTRMLMQKTAAALRRAALPPACHIGFNVCARHLEEGDILQDCRDFLEAFPPGAVRLVLELTERQPVPDTPRMDALWDELHRLGVWIAIDDFGTGHSSLAYLQTLHVDELKIDQSFVAGIGTDSLTHNILDSVLALAVKLDMTIVAEGVETEAQQRYLSDNGAHLLQGYLFAKPMPLADFIQQLPSHAPSAKLAGHATA